MQKRLLGYLEILLLSLLLSLRFTATAQTKDSSSIIRDTSAVVPPVEQLQVPIAAINSATPIYDFLNPDKKGLRPVIFYSNDDRFFVGLNYNWYSDPFVPDSVGSKNQLYAHYSIDQNAFSVGYQRIFNRLFGRWNLVLDAGYDWVKWTNFSGLGNESVEVQDNRNYYRIRSKEVFVSTAFQHRIGKQSNIVVTPFYQRVRLIEDEDRYLSQASFNGKKLENYERHNFGGIRTDLWLQHVDNPILPTKGVILSTSLAHVRNLNDPLSYTNYSGYTRFYIPLLQHFVISIEGGAATTVGEPEFYQLNSIGGSSLRGFRRDRFWAETVFHNNNELQYLFDSPEKLFKGKLGLLAFADQGRVWKKGEVSDKWHYGYGGGIIVVPYNQVYLSVQYGISEEWKGFYFDFRRAF